MSKYVQYYLIDDGRLFATSCRGLFLFDAKDYYWLKMNGFIGMDVLIGSKEISEEEAKLIVDEKK